MNRSVSIGGPIALMVIGAVMYFALQPSEAGGFDLRTLGVILGAGGLVWLLISLFLGTRKEETSVGTVTKTADSAGNVQTTEQESNVEER